MNEATVNDVYLNITVKHLILKGKDQKFMEGSNQFNCLPLKNLFFPFCSLLKRNKNSAAVDIAHAFGEITTACNVGQAKNGSWCLLEE